LAVDVSKIRSSKNNLCLAIVNLGRNSSSTERKEEENKSAADNRADHRE
jgi:hypothetical protein